jgi:hypothetical protein
MTLSDDERARAQRFVFDRDRSRFTVARGVLRNILGRYLQRPPSSIRFGYGPHGKPHLEAPPNQLLPTLRFNVSHSADLVLIAVAHDREVGVDVEQIRTDFALDELARRFFSQEEVAAIELRTGLGAMQGLTVQQRVERYVRVRRLFLRLEHTDIANRERPSPQDLSEIYSRATTSYLPRPFVGKVTLFLSDDPRYQPFALRWRAIASEVAVHAIPGNHQTSITQHIQELGDLLSTCLQKAQGKSLVA